MLAKIASIANIGLETVPVTVEVDVAESGFPGFTIVGLASKAVEEARERVKTAIINSGLEFPSKKITVNLAPADLPKDGAAYDLPIAVGVLLASGQLSMDSKINLARVYFYGELSLDGMLRPTRGILLLALFAQKKRLSEIVVPFPSANEASMVTGIKKLAVKTLPQLVRHITGQKIISPLKRTSAKKLKEEKNLSFAGFGGSAVKGNEYLSIDFNYFELLDIEQARNLIVQIAQLFLKNLNSNEYLQKNNESPYNYPGMTCGVWRHRPDSRGFVRLRSGDVFEDPVIQPNYLQDPRDQQGLLDGIHLARRLLRTPELAKFVDSETLPGPATVGDADLLDFARSYGVSSYHPNGTAHMGPASDPTAVVDDQLRVHGLQGLRIADSSVIPSIPSANICAATMMIGEKAADMIRGRAPLKATDLQLTA